MTMTREARKQHNANRTNKSSYNAFSPLQNEVEFSIWIKFGHEETKCRRRMNSYYQHENKTDSPKVWKKKITSSENSGLALYVGDQ